MVSEQAMETVRDYSVYIVELKKRIVDLEKYCLHGVVKDDAQAYRTINDTVSNMVTTLTYLYEWADINERTK
jgi:hypothetical protein